MSRKEPPARLNIEQVDLVAPTTEDKAIASRAKGEHCPPVIELRVENTRLWLQFPACPIEGVEMDHAAAGVSHGQGGTVRAPNAITGSTPGKFRHRPQGARL